MKICQAFQWAKDGVSLTHGLQQAEIFQMLVKEEVEDLDAMLLPRANSAQALYGHQTPGIHKCSVFGPFQKGKYKVEKPFEVQLKNMAPKVTSLKGRQKDMFKIIQQILKQNGSRLLTLMGLPGIGKSSLIANTLDYISERSLLKGGSIYINARGITDCEVFLRNFNTNLISDNPILFGKAKNQSQHKQQSITIFNLILTKISIIDGNILLVIDNAEDLITKDKNDFKILISLILQRVP